MVPSNSPCSSFKKPIRLTQSLRQGLHARTLPYAWLPTDVPTRTIFFLVHKWRVLEETHLIISRLLRPFFYKEDYQQKWYQKGLQIVLEESHKEYLQVSLQGYSTLMCHHEHKLQESQRRVRWGTHCKGFCSKEGPHYRIERSSRNPLEHDQVWRVLGNRPGAVIGQVTVDFYSQV